MPFTRMTAEQMPFHGFFRKSERGMTYKIVRAWHVPWLRMVFIVHEIPDGREYVLTRDLFAWVWWSETD